MELHRETGIRQKTCWYFKRKIQEAMRNDSPNLLKGVVEVDECLIGGPEKNKQGRSSDSNKHKVLVMVEHVKNKKGEITMGKAYAALIDGYAAEDLLIPMQKHISTEAYVSADKWRAYIQKDFPNLCQEYLDSGKNFPLIHLHIMNIKGWIRGVHHHCSNTHIGAYLNEYNFRFNLRTDRRQLFNKLVANMVAAAHLFISLQALCA
jgi:hypothetical protein